MRHEYQAEGEKPRFFVILNKNPQQDPALLLTSASRNISARIKQYGANSVVVIHKDEYGAFTEDSVLCFADVEPLTVDEFKKRVRNGRITLKEALSEDLVDRILKTIPELATIDEKQRRIILGGGG